MRAIPLAVVLLCWVSAARALDAQPQPPVITLDLPENALGSLVRCSDATLQSDTLTGCGSSKNAIVCAAGHSTSKTCP